jgi:plasmid stabilization system protein ParE
MSPYYLSPRATADMDALGEYYTDRSPAYWERAEDRLIKKFLLVGRFPRLGKAVEEYRPGLRKTPIGDFVVYFQSTPTGTEIVRVVHGAQHVTPADFQED